LPSLSIENRLLQWYTGIKLLPLPQQRINHGEKDQKRRFAWLLTLALLCATGNAGVYQSVCPRLAALD
jgi:hypothetical protein